MRLADVLNFDSPKAMIVRRVMGHPIVIEYPKGSIRLLRNDDGDVVWKKRMYSDYGYIRGTKGRDGDEVDVMLGPLQHFAEVYVVHMKDMGPDKAEREDEDKCMLGFSSADAAKKCFLLHYPANFFESMSVMPVATFRKRLRTSQLPHREKKIHADAAITL